MCWIPSGVCVDVCPVRDAANRHGLVAVPMSKKFSETFPSPSAVDATSQVLQSARPGRRRRAFYALCSVVDQQAWVPELMRSGSSRRHTGPSATDRASKIRHSDLSSRTSDTNVMR